MRALFAGVLSLAALSSCREPDPYRVIVDLRMAPEATRPDHLLFDWSAGSEAFIENHRFPETGPLPPGGSLGSIVIVRDGPLQSERLFAARGLRAGMVVAQASLLVGPGPERTRRVTATLLPSGSGPTPEVSPEAADAGAPADASAAADVAIVVRTLPDASARPDAATRDLATPGEPPGPRDADRAGDPPGPRDADREPPDVGPLAAEVSRSDDLSLGLVGDWRLDDPRTASEARDSSGQDNPGLLISLDPRASWTAGRLGGALDFTTGALAAMAVAPSASIASITTGFTIAAWTFRTEDSAGNATLLSRQAGDTTAEHYALLLRDGRPKLWINTENPTILSLTASGTVALGRWVHLAATYDGAVARLYADGAQLASAPYALPIAPDDTPLIIGAAFNGPSGVLSENYQGVLDDVLLYDRALDPTQIARLAAGEAPPPH